MEFAGRRMLWKRNKHRTEHTKENVRMTMKWNFDLE